MISCMNCRHLESVMSFHLCWITPSIGLAILSVTHVTRSEPTTFRFGRKQSTGVMGLRGSEYYKSKFYLAFPNLILCVRNSPGRCCFSQQGLSRVLLIIDGATACGGSVGLFPQLTTAICFGQFHSRAVSLSQTRKLQ